MPDTLDAIGAILTDYEASRDAMRWTPERVICDGGKPLCIGDDRLVFGAARLFAPVVTIRVDTSQFFAAFRNLAEALGPAFQSLGEAVAKIGGVANTSPQWHALMYPRSHRRRCRVCNPWGNQPPEAGWYKPGPKAARMRRRRR